MIFLNKKQVLYLSGGGDEKQSYLFDKFFFAALPQNSKFLYIPIALRGHKIYHKTSMWLNKVLKMQKRIDLKFEVANNLSQYQLKNLHEFSAIYIGGGNTWSLLSEIRKTGFNKSLIKYIKNGGFVYGGSAGAIILGKKIDTQNDSNAGKIKSDKGLNLIHEHAIACHFEKKQEALMKTWVRKNMISLLCIPEDSGLIIKNTTASCIGEKPCVLYYTNGRKKTIFPEKTIKLKNT